MIGYYNLRTNRVTMYDLTGADGLARSGDACPQFTAHINQILSQPAAERTVATIVHEATHQLAYNCGHADPHGRQSAVGQRRAGALLRIARLRSDRGWRTIGAVNRVHSGRVSAELARREPNSLASPDRG
jgi:hypothetical protein